MESKNAAVIYGVGTRPVQPHIRTMRGTISTKKWGEKVRVKALARKFHPLAVALGFRVRVVFADGALDVCA